MNIASDDIYFLRTISIAHIFTICHISYWRNIPKHMYKSPWHTFDCIIRSNLSWYVTNIWRLWERLSEVRRVLIDRVKALIDRCRVLQYLQKSILEYYSQFLELWNKLQEDVEEDDIYSEFQKVDIYVSNIV